MRRPDVYVLAILLSGSLALNVFLILMSGLRPDYFHWRDEYDYVIIEIKCWVCQNGTSGFQPTAMVRMVPLDSRAAADTDYGWVGDPFKLDNRYAYAFSAPPEYYGKKWLFWQSEKTLMIVPNRTLTLLPGFESDSWWQNYG